MKITKYLKNPKLLIKYFKIKRLQGIYGQKLDDVTFLKKRFKLAMGKELNLENPKTFNEKLQWLKLYDRKPEQTMMVDKYLARNYIAEKIGEEHLIPLLGVWDNADDIDFDALPDQFVLKCNHNSGLGMCICKDKSKLNIKKVKKQLKKGLKQDYYLTGREGPYKDVPRKIIAEKYMKDSRPGEECLTDYKFFCFNGEPKILYMSKDQAKKPYTDFFDMEFNHLKLKMKDINSEIPPEKPYMFNQMKEFAKILSNGFAHVRVDFYCIDNVVYVGELTFFHNSGFCKITPEEWDYKLGEWIELPKELKCKK